MDKIKDESVTGSNTELVEKIKDWVKLDSEINLLNSELKDKKKMKKTLTDNLVDLMKEQDIEIVKLNDGSIELKRNKVKKSINKNHLLKCLTEHITDLDAVNDVIKTIFDSRAVEIKEYIKRN
jgi:hypothetical protein